MIYKRISHGMNKTAASRQWVWVLDFDGFGFYDQSPSTAMQTVSLMKNYPEMLSCVIVIDGKISLFLFPIIALLFSMSLPTGCDLLTVE